MARYSSRRPTGWIADDLDEWPNPLITSVEVCDHQAVNTGLLDADGNEIWRAPEPIGFIHYD